MRKLIVVAMLSLAACSGNKQANNSAIAEESAGEVTAVNDTTAIDAATGAAANMAADVNYTVDMNETGEADNATSPSRPSKRSGSRPPAHQPDEPGVANNSEI